MIEEDRRYLLELTAQIISSVAENKMISTEALSDAVRAVYAALAEVSQATEPTAPAVPAADSVTDENIVCLECGTRHKMLRRHLRTAHGMTPEEYRAKWKLPSEYPMVAPNTASRRRDAGRAARSGGKTRRSD